MTTEEYNQSVDRFSDNIFRFALKTMRDEERARDVVQDTWEKLWRNVSDVNNDKVKSWLFATAYNTMVDQIRRDKKKGEYNETTVKRISHNQHYSDLSEILNEALSKLPEIQKSVIMLRDYEGYNYDEIGEITNLNESQVKVYIFRARKFLKEYIGSIEAVV